MTNPIRGHDRARRRRRRSRRAADWPGWSRSGKTEELALEALVAYAAALRRRSPSRARAGSPASSDPRRLRGRRAERRARPARSSACRATRPSRTPARPMPDEAPRLAGLVEAAWALFDRVAGGRARGAPQGPARRRPEHLEGRRPRDGRRSRVREPDRDQGRDVRTRRPAAVRRHARRDARGPAGRPRRARRSPAAAGPPATPPTGSRGTPSTTPGRSRTARRRSPRSSPVRRPTTDSSLDRLGRAPLAPGEVRCGCGGLVDRELPAADALPRPVGPGILGRVDQDLDLGGSQHAVHDAKRVALNGRPGRHELRAGAGGIRRHETATGGDIPRPVLAGRVLDAA